MAEPTTLATVRPDALAHLMAGIARRCPDVARGPVDDAPSPDEPGHPEYHRARRTEWALSRWRTAVPPRYRRAESTRPAVQAWADAVAADPESAGSVLLTGTTGTGKTHEAYGALRRIAECGPERYHVIATTVVDMYGRMRPSPEDELRRLTRVPLLLLDDLGSGKVTEWTEEVTYRLINERYNACLPTIYTSNLPADSRDREGRRHGPDLITTLGERIASRLAEDVQVIAFKGRDLRRSA
ncbi:ATP-binding protein [Streptomyces sp. NBC_01511]|uniref:ATP-binding protein n=1 Tax=Streptomyces sp. NBC_01511 TaxID=2903889 RepID=UPI003868F2B1